MTESIFDRDLLNRSAKKSSFSCKRFVQIQHQLGRLGQSHQKDGEGGEGGDGNTTIWLYGVLHRFSAAAAVVLGDLDREPTVVLSKYR